MAKVLQPGCGSMFAPLQTQYVDAVEITRRISTWRSPHEVSPLGCPFTLVAFAIALPAAAGEVYGHGPILGAFAAVGLYGNGSITAPYRTHAGSVIRSRCRSGPRSAAGQVARRPCAVESSICLRARTKWAARAHSNKSAAYWAVSTGPSRCRSRAKPFDQHKSSNSRGCRFKSCRDRQHEG